LSKFDPAYWKTRLFKNTFTYKGSRVEVSGWSVKIQLFGKRKTFSLAARARAQAAGEACEIYQSILDHGWEGVSQGDGRAISRPATKSRSVISPASIGSDVEYWKRRLLPRKYPEQQKSPGPGGFSVRIEHARRSRYFPLGTSDETEAASRAMRIFQVVVSKGLAAACASFPCELSLALRWQDCPLAWTYTTIHTATSAGSPAMGASGRSRQYSVALIEPDSGIRLALAVCVNGQRGFQCAAAFSDTEVALREIPRRRVDLVLANHDLRTGPGATCLEELRRAVPGVAGLSYSVFEDTDELFRATPGGAVVYMLKRTGPSHFLEPIADIKGSLGRESIATQVREYFQRHAASLPAGPPTGNLAKLTPREHEVLAQLSKGLLAKEIAEVLGISNWTVHGHVKSIFEKLGVHTRTEAVIRYLQK